MENSKTIIRHEILNLLTAVNMIVGSTKIDNADKEEILRLIKVVGLLINYEGLFMGQKVKFLREEIKLDGLLDLIAMIHEYKFREARCAFNPADFKISVREDKSVLKSFLEQTLLILCDKAKTVQISFEKDKNALIITFKGGRTGFPRRMTLSECLQERSCLKEELPFQLALHLASLSGIRIEFNKKKIMAYLRT